MLIFKRFQTQYVDSGNGSPPPDERPISPDAVRAEFSDCGDFIWRETAVGRTAATAYLCWIDGTVSGQSAAEQVLRPLTDPVRFPAQLTAAEAAALIASGTVYGADMTRAKSMDELTRAVACGSCARLLGQDAFLFQCKTNQRRTVQEPTIEKSVKGSKDAFVETLRVNTALVRSRLRTPALKLRQVTLGRKSRTEAAILWLDGVCAPDIPAEIARRLDALDVDGVILPGVLDSALSDAPRSFFPQLIHTERPDKLASALLDGRAAVIADGIPVAFIAPAALPEFLKTSEDGSQHYIASSFLLLLRWAAFIGTLLLPAVYVAIAMYHAEMIPTELLFSIIHSKQSVPFSTTAEILGMLLAFELLQEAGLRLPNPIGQTVSIIGALIVGQSAVEAKVISPIAVIVVALAGIAGYTMPSQDMGTALRLCRFGLAAAAALAGMFGIAVGGALIVWRLCSIESFGRPYAVTSRTGSQGIFVRRPPWKDLFRDIAVNGGDLRRRR